jgi:dolichol-phosphate mannosyltransferase
MTLADQPLVTLLIPVYYEQDNIVPLFQQIRQFVSVPHVYMVIYDYDDDPTLLRVNDVLEIDSRARFVKNVYGPGIINAMKTGFQMSETPYIVPLMADLSDSPETVDQMYEKMQEGYDLVVASRYAAGGGKIGGPFLKYVLSRFANLTLYNLSGIPTHDMTNAFITAVFGSTGPCRTCWPSSRRGQLLCTPLYAQEGDHRSDHCQEQRWLRGDDGDHREDVHPRS